MSVIVMMEDVIKPVVILLVVLCVSVVMVTLLAVSVVMVHYYIHVYMYMCNA